MSQGRWRQRQAILMVNMGILLGAARERLTDGIPRVNHEVSSNPTLVQPVLNGCAAYEKSLDIVNRLITYT